MTGVTVGRACATVSVSYWQPVTTSSLHVVQSARVCHASCECVCARACVHVCADKGCSLRLQQLMRCLSTRSSSNSLVSCCCRRCCSSDGCDVVQVTNDEPLLVLAYCFFYFCSDRDLHKLLFTVLRVHVVLDDLHSSNIVVCGIAVLFHANNFVLIFVSHSNYCYTHSAVNSRNRFTWTVNNSFRRRLLFLENSFIDTLTYC